MLKDDESLSEFLLPQKRLPFFRRCAAWLLSQKYFQIKVLSGTAIGVLVITLLAGLFIFMAYRDQEQERIRTHTVKVMRLSSVIEGDIAALETGYRGFLLTGKASYLEPFERRRVELKNRVDMLGGLIQATPAQRKRVMKLQEFTQLWVSTVALPEMSRPRAGVPAPAGNSVSATTLGNSILEQARDVLQSIQNEEQLMANTRMRDREWAALSIQILDLLPKLDRSAAEMEKEKRGYLLTGDSSFVEAYKRAITRFSSYHGYLSILVANGSEQPTSLAEIRTKAELWIKNSAAPEMEAKRLGQNVSVALIESGDALMAEIRERIAAFEKKEMELYEVRSIAAERQRTVRNSGLGILCLLAISLLVVPNGYSCALVQRQLSKLNGVEARNQIRHREHPRRHDNGG